MLTITLMRHAKSCWDYPDLSDFERPLNKRGQKDATLMANVFASLGWQAPRILASPSKRTLETLDIFVKARVFKKENIATADSVYEASTADLIDLLSQQNNDHRGLLIVGHNPGLNSLISLLSGLDIGNLPTCGVAVLSTDGDHWQGIQSYHFKLRCLLTPKGNSLCRPLIPG